LQTSSRAVDQKSKYYATQNIHRNQTRRPHNQRHQIHARTASISAGALGSARKPAHNPHSSVEADKLRKRSRNVQLAENKTAIGAPYIYIRYIFQTKKYVMGSWT